MTCIVAIAEAGKVYMAGDSAAVADSHYLHHINRPKVFKNGKYLIGYTSSFRMGQLIEIASLPEPPEKEHMYTFMISTFVDAIRRITRDGGFLKAENNREEIGTFLVGVQGELYKFGCDGAILQFIDNYDAVGSGESCALASLYTSHNTLTPPSDRLIKALEATQRFVTTVREPFYSYES